jgi:lysozyme
LNYSKDGLHLTEQFEGLRLNAYPDPATGGEPYTIGYGHTGPEVHLEMTITQEQAELYLQQDVLKAQHFVNNLNISDLTQGQFDALVDFAFNCGCGNLQKSTLLAKVKSGDIEGAAQEFLKWDMAAGKHMAGLARRRQAEMHLFLEKV